MIHDQKYVSLSKNDENRLTIYDCEEKEIAHLVHGARKAFLMNSAITAVVMIALAIPFVIYDNMAAKVLLGFLMAGDLFMFAVNVNLYRKNVYDFRTRSHYIKVELLEKLPIETVVLKENKARKVTFDFYPARAKDLKRTNYTTTIYLKKEEYDNFKAGEIMTIYVSVSKDRKAASGR